MTPSHLLRDDENRLEARYLLSLALSLVLFGGALVAGLAYHLINERALPGISLEHLAEADRHAALENYERAAMAYRVAAAVAPDDDRALVRLGLAARQLGDSRQTIDAFRRVLRVNPRHVGAHYFLGLTYLEQGDLERAARHGAAAARLAPDSADAHATLGAILIQQGKRAEAGRRFRQALRLSPDLDLARRGLAELGEASGTSGTDRR